MAASVTDLPLVQAMAAWTEADRLALAAEGAQEAMRKAQTQLRWAQPANRPTAVGALQAALAALKSSHRAAAEGRRKALLASGRAARAIWGVGLGERHVFISDAQERLEFAVDFLRPCPGVDTVHGGQTPFVCAGEHAQEGERHLVVLGDSHRPLQGPSDNVVYLRNILRAPAA